MNNSNVSQQERNEQELKKRNLNNLMRDMTKLLKYLDDPTVTDIAVQDTGEIIVSMFGKGRVCTEEFLTESEVLRIILSCATVVGITVSPNSPLPKLEAVIPGYNARITGLLPPKTIKPVISIRKPATEVYSLEQYVKNGQMRQDQYDLVVSYIKERKNIIVSGSTGSGKTTFTNAVIKKMEEFTPLDNFYIVEDVPELQCNARMRISICTETEHAAGAVIQALRFNPNRIIFGEVRRAEQMIALYTAWNTGHSGNVTTIHANNCASTLTRIDRLLIGNGIGNKEHLSEVIHLVVHLSKTPDGIRVDEILPVDHNIEDFLKDMEQDELG